MAPKRHARTRSGPDDVPPVARPTGTDSSPSATRSSGFRVAVMPSSSSPAREWRCCEKRGKFVWPFAPAALTEIARHPYRGAAAQARAPHASARLGPLIGVTERGPPSYGREPSQVCQHRNPGPWTVIICPLPLFIEVRQMPRPPERKRTRIRGLPSTGGLGRQRCLRVPRASNRERRRLTRRGRGDWCRRA